MKIKSEFKFYLLVIVSGMTLFFISEILASPSMPDASWPQQNLSQER